MVCVVCGRRKRGIRTVTSRNFLFSGKTKTQFCKFLGVRDTVRITYADELS